MTPEFVKEIILRGEDFNRELKSARRTFDRNHDLPDYCAALANERGGYLILGVSDDRQIVGTAAFTGNHNRLSHFLYQRLRIRVNVYELRLDGKRVLAFDVPSRNPGEFVKSNGRYFVPMRLGESLQAMDDNTMRDILNETLEDFSALAAAVSLSELDNSAVSRLVELYCKKRGISTSSIDIGQLLHDLCIVSGRKLTNTGLLLAGKGEAIERILPQAEIIFEWRQTASQVNYDFRRSWKKPITLALDELWAAIDARNIRIPFQEGLAQREVVAFDEKSIREAVLNAVAHRDYRIATDSIFIKVSPQEFKIISPGGFIAGVNAENAIDESSWRNRRLAESLQQLGLVERSGQGLDDIYLRTIQDGKGQPMLAEVDRRQVSLVVPAMVKDAEFIKFLERVAKDKQIAFTPREMITLEGMRSQGSMAQPYHKERLMSLGIVERLGRGRGVKYILSGTYYAYANKKGIHTRLVGASRATKKQLILDHIKRHSKVYNYELQDAFQDMKMQSISVLLNELSQEDKVRHEGSKRYGYWVLNSN